MTRSAIVLGAGIVGVSVALHLQARGVQVTLVDRRGPGEETSHGNAGLIESSCSQLAQIEHFACEFEHCNPSRTPGPGQRTDSVTVGMPHARAPLDSRRSDEYRQPSL